MQNNISFYTIADGLGNFINNALTLQTQHLHHLYMLTATSSSTGDFAQTFFTDEQLPTVTTNLDDYLPNDTVFIRGNFWQPGETVMLVLIESPGGFHLPDTFYSVADVQGNIYNFDFVVAPHDTGQTFTLNATGLSSGGTAQTLFTDAQAANLDQIRNGSSGSPNNPVNWVNGNANSSQAHFVEGWSMPYRMQLTGF